MKIKITKSGNKWRADLKNLPGMAPNGLGKTKREAVADLFREIIADQINEDANWLQCIDPYESIEIN